MSSSLFSTWHLCSSNILSWEKQCKTINIFRTMDLGVNSQDHCMHIMCDLDVHFFSPTLAITLLARCCLSLGLGTPKLTGIFHWPTWFDIESTPWFWHFTFQLLKGKCVWGVVRTNLTGTVAQVLLVPRLICARLSPGPSYNAFQSASGEIL